MAVVDDGARLTSERELAVWDGGSLSNVRKLNIDQSAGVLMPFWSDNGLLFLAGKGDGNIRCVLPQCRHNPLMLFQLL